MQVDDADPTPTREEVLEFFTDHISGLVPQHQDALKADYLPLVYVGFPRTF